MLNILLWPIIETFISHTQNPTLMFMHNISSIECDGGAHFVRVANSSIGDNSLAAQGDRSGRSTG